MKEAMKPENFVYLLFLAVWMGGCSIGQEARRAQNVYDFGLPVERSTAQPAVPGSVVVAEINMPVWMNSTALNYRLVYHDPARLQAYADSRWAASPASLLTLRLRQALGGTSSGSYQLRVELQEFSQVFDSQNDSRGLVRASASLIRTGESKQIAARAFTVERKAQTADAVGGVRALTQAGDELVSQMAVWAGSAMSESSQKK